MKDFLNRFGDKGTPDNRSFSNVRSGTIVGLLSIGTLLGAIVGAPIADKFGRRPSIVWWNIVFIVGVIVQITTNTHWYQIVIGRWVAGLGVGALSVLTPMYQSETAPRQIRGSLVSCYQLFITAGIFIAYCINYGTETRQNPSSWRIPMGVGFVFPVIMAVGICFLSETPRWEYRHGKIESARRTIAKSYGVPESHWEVQREIREIKAKLDAENAGGSHPWYEVFTGPRMAYRTLLGMTLQMLQQLTGANFLFYYGTTIFQATGIRNSYITQIILGVINFATTFLALWVVENLGRRKSLIAGGLWMFVCFMVFASVGHFALDRNTPTNTPKAGAAMIVFACLFIFAYAATWGPIIWCIIGEIYPSRYRAKAMGLATSSNWIWNFLLSFFTPFITPKIDFRYGYVFAACCFAGAVVTYFFVCESQGRTLEEIDTMYILHVKPWESSKWTPPDNEELVTADALNLTSGARGIRKDRTDGQGEDRTESVSGPAVLGNQPTTMTGAA
ncbi:general substrate transporter [Myriangium duriaei CBS 260.36]|uniref:General substrate transporter n=1 Tax=Myriangium duriaei CBS 260.36 TaxID=1168546 RepID=A0A9P4IXC6_9PEZI|nr:general substrate transporter [Myriangium duriaei CBS 260.36]